MFVQTYAVSYRPQRERKSESTGQTKASKASLIFCQVVAFATCITGLRSSATKTKANAVMLAWHNCFISICSVLTTYCYSMYW